MKSEYDFKGAKRGPVLKRHAGKTRVTIPVDDGVLKWFVKQVHNAGGGDFGALMSEALREYVASREGATLETVVRKVVREELRLRKAV